MNQNLIANPFNITKATDFSDQQINDFWVDFPDGGGFNNMAKPTSPMPMIILGGKGSGKTHLMRYYSFSLQQIRFSGNALNAIADEGYLGIYIRCGGLNSSRFQNKGQSNDTWNTVFAYAFELWLSQLLLGTFLDGFIGNIDERKHHQICNEILELFDVIHEQKVNSILDIKKYLGSLQKDLDFKVNNCAMTGALNLEIAITQGKMIFGIPQILSNNLPFFKNCIFLYLIDEFENLTEIQQKYVNTLVREKEAPSSFKIGARTYGIKTYRTFSAEEENKPGSEFEFLPLDTELRNKKSYNLFAKKLIIRRLRQNGIISIEPENDDQINKLLFPYFEFPPTDLFETHETQFIFEKYKDLKRPYIISLEKKLKEGIDKDLANGLLKDDQIPEILDLLQIYEYPLLEKLNIFLFYKAWFKNESLLESARRIRRELPEFIKDPSKRSKHSGSFYHFKSDLLAQLLRECDQKQKYRGIDVFIEMSWGFPKNLFILLKQIYSWSMFNGEKPFIDGTISIKSQNLGVKEASDWFFRDSQKIGKEGRAILEGIQKLGNFLKTMRFSDKPTECSCSSFSIDLSKLTVGAKRIIKAATDWSLLIDVSIRRGKNKTTNNPIYQFNRMLAPRWDLSIYRRGTIPLDPSEVNAIFDPESPSKDYESILQSRFNQMTAPGFGKKIKIPKEIDNQGELFF